MTQDEILEIAKEVYGDIGWTEASIARLVAFANLVAAKEREACAKVCENMAIEWEDQPQFAQVEIATMMDCALAIRARGEQA
jgi:hypothetical protein